jgi:hypothetical protein
LLIEAIQPGQWQAPSLYFKRCDDLGITIRELPWSIKRVIAARVETLSNQQSGKLTLAAAKINKVDWFQYV